MILLMLCSNYASVSSITLPTACPSFSLYIGAPFQLLSSTILFNNVLYYLSCVAAMHARSHVTSSLS